MLSKVDTIGLGLDWGLMVEVVVLKVAFWETNFPSSGSRQYEIKETIASASSSNSARCFVPSCWRKFRRLSSVSKTVAAVYKVTNTVKYYSLWIMFELLNTFLPSEFRLPPAPPLQYEFHNEGNGNADDVVGLSTNLFTQIIFSVAVVSWAQYMLLFCWTSVTAKPVPLDLATRVLLGLRYSNSII